MGPGARAGARAAARAGIRPGRGPRAWAGARAGSWAVISQGLGPSRGPGRDPGRGRGLGALVPGIGPRGFGPGPQVPGWGPGPGPGPGARSPHQQTRDPIPSLPYLFKAIVPYAHDIFAPTRRLGLHKLLGRNNYVMEAAFVAGVVGLAKFFDEPQWPCGVYKWPPESPPEFAEHVEVPLALSPGAVPAGSSAGSSVGTLASAAAGSSSAMAEKKATPPH